MITDNGQFANAFIGANSAAPLCGRVINLFSYSSKLKQAKIANGITDKVILAGLPAQVDNRVGAPGTNQNAGFNADVLEITALGTLTANIAGFVLAGAEDMINTDGGIGYPHVGMMANLALLGSGIETWLPCDAALANVSMLTPVCWASGVLTATLGTDTALPIHLLSSVIDGYYQKVDTNGYVNWTACKCIRVQL
jgi:hypothetical protein